jgi:putative Mg2+ transporter-C (MgtC) family protein
MGPELPLLEAVARLSLALVLAGAVGVERELHEHQAGLRTHMLVGVGAALFVMVGNYAWGDLEFGNATGIVLDPSRVVAYVVTGVGFLGAGAILKHGANVRGLTTAASLWAVAAIGVTVGSGLYALGLVATALVLLSLWPVRGLVSGLGPARRRRVEVELEPGGKVADILQAVESAGGEVVSASIRDDGKGRSVVIVLAGRDAEAASLFDQVLQLPTVKRANVTG